MLNQMPDQVRHDEIAGQARNDGNWMLKQIPGRARDDVVQHDGIQHDLITERGWDDEVQNQVQDD